jgi:hypothetical protein
MYSPTYKPAIPSSEIRFLRNLLRSHGIKIEYVRIKRWCKIGSAKRSRFGSQSPIQRSRVNALGLRIVNLLNDPIPVLSDISEGLLLTSFGSSDTSPLTYYFSAHSSFTTGIIRYSGKRDAYPA